jgi:hypothetical protein
MCGKDIPEGRQVCPPCENGVGKRLDEVIAHFDAVATMGRIEGWSQGMHGEVAEYLKRLKYYEEAIKAGRLMWKEV